MNIDKRLILLLAVTTSAAVAAFATRTRRQHVRVAGEEHKTNLHAWENEGGNLAPIPASAMQPVVQPAV